MTTNMQFCYLCLKFDLMSVRDNLVIKETARFIFFKLGVYQYDRNNNNF